MPKNLPSESSSFSFTSENEEEESDPICVDCEQRDTTFHMNGLDCTRCLSHWCSDWKDTFVIGSCDHLDKIYADKDAEGIHDEFCTQLEEMDVGICSSCYFSGDVQCIVEGCPLSLAKMKERWFQFCKTPILHCDILLENSRNEKLVAVQVFQHRKTENQESLVVWGVNRGIATNNMTSAQLQNSFGKNALQSAYRAAARDVDNLLDEGFTIRWHRGGHWNRFLKLLKRKRDTSPKRKNDD